MNIRQRIGPWLVVFGALLWSADAVFRSSLTAEFPAVFIVTVSHLLCLPLTFGALLKSGFLPSSFSSRQWGALLVLSLGGSVLAMVFFTQAFAMAANYNIPILLQKLQPIVAILLAQILLGELPTRSFYILALTAMAGGYLISFGDQQVFGELNDGRLATILYSLAAATIWGACTVAGRYLLGFQSQVVVTASRYFLATIFLAIATTYFGYWRFFDKIDGLHWRNFVLMAYIPGLLALFIYYSGLKNTPASLATIGELSFPLGAIFVNWYWLNSPLNFFQILGASMLIASTTLIHWRWSQNHQLIVHQAKI